MEAKLKELHRYTDSELFSEVERAAIEYADYLTRNPADVPDELFARLSHHLDERQLVELTAVIAWENFVGRFNRGFDIQSEGFSGESFCLARERPRE